MSFLSESDMMSKELQNPDLVHVNLMTDAFKIIVKYRHLSPSGNRADSNNLILNFASSSTEG